MIEPLSIVDTWVNGRSRRAPPILRQASIKVAAGEIVGVIGAADSSRRALLDIAAALSLPDRGEVKIGGIELTQLPRKDIENLRGDQVVWLSHSLHQSTRQAYNIVALPLSGRRPRQEIPQLVWNAFERVGASHLAERRWDSLSRWERVLVELARGIAPSPLLIVVDDLFVRLGIHRMQSVRELLRSLLDELGFGLLLGLAEHDWGPLADRLWRLDQGTLTPMPISYAKGPVALASELNERGYEDPAAMIAGSALEQHLRSLAAQAGVSVVRDDGKPRRAEDLNHALVRAGTYDVLQLKAVTAWLDLRNKATHGQHGSYNHAQVSALIRDVQDFMRRLPVWGAQQ
jgi:predicted ABC-type transport system involved in lysophospholipase L1 biosynthesis ATPase subunit